MPNPKRTVKSKSQNGHYQAPAAELVAALHQQMLARRSNQQRYEFLQQLLWAESRDVIKKHFRSLRSERAVKRWLALISSEELHTLCWDIAYDNHQNSKNKRNGRRLP